MTAKDTWTWVSENRATFPEHIGDCEQCGEPIYEGESFTQNVTREADGTTTVLLHQRCIDALADDLMAMARREGWA